MQYGRFIARLCREEGLRHFERDTGGCGDGAGLSVGSAPEEALCPLGDLRIRFARPAAGLARRTRLCWRAARCRKPSMSDLRSSLLVERLRELIVEGPLMVDVAG